MSFSSLLLLAQTQSEASVNWLLWVKVAGAIVAGLFAIVLLFFIATALLDGTVRLFARIAELFSGASANRFVTSLLALPKFVLLVLKNLRRNPLRSAMMFVATFVMVLIITIVWSILNFLENATSEKSQNIKAIITEKYQIPSRMPPRYSAELVQAALSLPADMRPDPNTDVMYWSFVGATTDLAKRGPETDVFFFSLNPNSIGTMMDDLELRSLSASDRDKMQKNIAAMLANPQAAVLGEGHLARLNKRVGDRVKVYSFNYKDLEFEVDIVGTLPRGRYDLSSMINADYFRRKLDEYERTKLKPHPMADKALNLVWIRFPNRAALERFADVVAQPGRFSSPSLKVEMASSAISTFLEAYKDIIWGFKYLFSPACLAAMTIVISNGISIGVRERRQEMAVMKVLGFRPWQILAMVLGEALFVGALGGTLATWLTYVGVNAGGGIQFPIAFFGKFKISESALWWGPVLGSMTALIGSVFPAWSARTVRVSEVFSKIA